MLKTASATQAKYLPTFFWLLLLYALVVLALLRTGEEIFEHLHLALDISNAILSLLLMLFLLGEQYRIQPNVRKYLVIGFGFAAATELLHALIGIEWSGWFAWVQTYSGTLRPATWPPSTYVLPLAMAWAFWLMRRNSALRPALFAAGIALLTAGLLALSLILPRYVDTGILGIQRPTQVPLLLLWAGVIAAYWRERHTHPLYEGLALMGVVLLLSDLCMLYSTSPHEKFTMMAHAGKMIAYTLLHVIQMRIAAEDSRGRSAAEAALRQSENRLRTIFEAEPECVKVVDRNGKLLEMNAAGLAMFEADSIGEVQRHTILNFVLPEHRPAFTALHKRVMGGESGVLEFEITGLGGARRWLETHAAPMRDAGGEVAMLLGITRDITERKRAELALRRYKLVIDTVNDGFWITDTMGNILEANAAYAKMSGYPVDELVNMHVSKLEAIEQSAEDVKKHIEKIIARGCERFETRHRHKHGHEIDVEVSATFMPESQQFFVFTHDITERKRAVAALHESEANMRAILDNSPYLVWLKDTGGRYIKVNKGYTDYIRQQDTRQIIGKTDFDLWPKELAEKYRADDAEVMSTLRQKHVEEQSLDDDRMHWVETFKTPILDENGNLLGTTGFARDITERKKAEEQIYNLAFYDPLTSLPNRRLLNDRLEQTMTASKRTGRHGALMFLDLDNFKPLNDIHGHDVGDLLLVEAARRIVGCVREVDTVARFGGDEFVVILSELDTDKTEPINQAGLVAEKIRAALAEPYVLRIQKEGKAETTIEHHCTSSIGVVLFLNHETGAEDVLKWADMAMYHAKENGRNGVQFYQPATRELPIL